MKYFPAALLLILIWILAAVFQLIFWATIVGLCSDVVMSYDHDARIRERSPLIFTLALQITERIWNG